MFANCVQRRKKKEKHTERGSDLRALEGEGGYHPKVLYFFPYSKEESERLPKIQSWKDRSGPNTKGRCKQGLCLCEKRDKSCSVRFEEEVGLELVFSLIC